MDKKETKKEIQENQNKIKTERTPEEIRELTNRLKRITGQVRGVMRMVEENDYCPDILIQVSAISSALNSFSKALLAKHIENCVMKNVEKGNNDSVLELVNVIQRMMK